MIGVFDSGVGGFLAAKHLHKLLPSADICCLADRKNAPYGTRGSDEIISLANNGILRLAALGASRVLIACCTASSVHEYLSFEARKISIPIIEASADAAITASNRGKIGVIATEATVRHGAFTNILKQKLPTAEVKEFQASALVPLIESGARDGHISDKEREKIKQILAPAALCDIDTLILGCTHFPHIEKTIRELLPSVTTISSAYEGARLAAEEYRDKESGKIIYMQ